MLQPLLQVDAKMLSKCVSQSKCVRVLNVKVLCAYVDVVHMVNLNCTLNVYVYCMYVYVTS